MLYSIQDGTLINLNYLGAVYMRKSSNVSGGSDLYDIFAIPYDKLSKLAVLQPHESNPTFEPIGSFEILLREKLSYHDAILELSSIAKALRHKHGDTK